MKVKKAFFVPIYGKVRQLTELENKELSLSAMYPIIGNDCHIAQLVRLKKGVDMWVDEEGLLKENVLNLKATILYQRAYPDVDPVDLAIVGNAIIVDNTKKGDFMTSHI